MNRQEISYTNMLFWTQNKLQQKGTHHFIGTTTVKGPEKHKVQNINCLPNII